jgi:hypothetical protein
MGDSSETFLEELRLPGPCLYLAEDSIPRILNNIDCFVSQSRGNNTVKVLALYPYAFNFQDDAVWDKVGQAVGNLQKLKRLFIGTRNYHQEDENSPKPDWEIVARILSHVRQRIALDVTNIPGWHAEDCRSFARAIHGHPTITYFEGSGRFPFESVDTLHSALATLPALESISLKNSGYQARPEDGSTMAHHESLTALLRVPSLRSVSFNYFSFTPTLYQATANAFMEGTAVTNLTFINCAFSTEGSDVMMANGLARNTSVSCIKVEWDHDGALCNVLAVALPSNSTLRDLSLYTGSNSAVHLSPVLLALGNNMGLKSLSLAWSGSIDESLCTAMQNGLGTNETLESLELKHVRLCDDTIDLWCRALSFLRTDKALKSLVVHVLRGVSESCLSAFRIIIASMLEENASLESLSIQCWDRLELKAEQYIALVTHLQHNSTLETLRTGRGSYFTIRLTDDEDKDLAKILKKNYALESLDLENQAGDAGAILRLNAAGRRYLIEDGSSISKGIEVLSAVRSDINCVFLHLLENPRLCHRSAESSRKRTKSVEDDTSSAAVQRPSKQAKETSGVDANESETPSRKQAV